MQAQDYRMLPAIDWAALDGQKVELLISKNYLPLRTKEGQVLTFGKVKRQVKAKVPSTSPVKEVRKA
jgi:hypothetical protein